MSALEANPAMEKQLVKTQWDLTYVLVILAIQEMALIVQVIVVFIIFIYVSKSYPPALIKIFDKRNIMYCPVTKEIQIQIYKYTNNWCNCTYSIL